MYKIKGFREKLVCIVSTFLIFMFVDQLLLMNVFSQLYFLTSIWPQGVPCTTLTVAIHQVNQKSKIDIPLRSQTC